MKKIFILVLVLVGVTFAQETRILNFGTIENNVQETLYLKFDDLNFSKIDSIAFSIVGTGRAALDTVLVYQGGANVYTTTATVIAPSFTATVAGTPVWKAGGIFKTEMAYAEALKVTIDPTHTGNTPADPNKLLILAKIYGTRR